MIWNTLIGAFFGSLVASAIVARLTQLWIERRERRGRRDDLRLELYMDVIELVLDNQYAIDAAGAEGTIPSDEIQRKRLSISHRLKLLGSAEVNAAYRKYRHLVFQETGQDVEYRPRNPDEVNDARDRLITAMATDIQRDVSDLEGI